MFRYLLLIVLCSVLFACTDSPTQASLDDYRFVDVFGQRREDTTGEIYSLQCSNWRSARYKTDSLVWSWTNKHPEATVYYVYSVSSNDPKTDKQLTSTYCWLVNGKDTINTWLVRNGACYAKTMLLPEGTNFNEIKAGKNKMATRVNIDEAAYKTFASQVKSAEAYAQAHRLGLWSLPDSLR